jgi:hypothetical protein
MASPINVTTAPTVLIGVNLKRNSIILQNNSKEDVYVKKQNLKGAPIVPTSTNYDFILHGSVGEGNDGEKIEMIETVAAFIGVTTKGTAAVGVSETVKVTL